MTVIESLLLQRGNRSEDISWPESVENVQIRLFCLVVETVPVLIKHSDFCFEFKLFEQGAAMLLYSSPKTRRWKIAPSLELNAALRHQKFTPPQG